MDEGQFHIFIYGGSETVGRGRDFLRGQEAELNRAMNDFMQCCKDEELAFKQSVNSIGNQCYNSAQLSEEAARVVSKAGSRVDMADRTYRMFFDFIGVAEQMVYNAESFLSQADKAVSFHIDQLSRIKNSLESVQWNIDCRQADIDRFLREIKINQGFYKDAMKSGNINAANEAQGNIKRCQSCIESIKSHPSYSGDLDEREKLLKGRKEHEEQLKFARQIKASSESALNAARSHLQSCRQKAAEAEALKRKAETLKQNAETSRNNAEKSHRSDAEKLRDLKQCAKKSDKELKDLAGDSLNIQREASENLLDNAAVMDKLSRLMYDYETFSIAGGRS